MSRDIQDFVSAFGVGASVGNAIRRTNIYEDQVAGRGKGGGRNQELDDFDKKYGSKLGIAPKRKGLLGRIGGAIGSWAGGSSGGASGAPAALGGGGGGAGDSGGWDNGNGGPSVAPPSVADTGGYEDYGLAETYADGGAVEGSAADDLGRQRLRQRYEDTWKGVDPEARRRTEKRNGPGNWDRYGAADDDEQNPDRKPRVGPFIRVYRDGGEVVGALQRRALTHDTRAVNVPGTPLPDDYPIMGRQDPPPEDGAGADERMFDQPSSSAGAIERNFPPYTGLTNGQGDDDRVDPRGAGTEAFDTPRFEGAEPPTRENGGGSGGGSGGGNRTGAVTQTGKGGGRKRLRDQTRTEAFDEKLDKDDPDNVIGKMIDGGLMFAQHTFHMTAPTDRAVGPDPHAEGGKQAFMQGVGAASSSDIQGLDRVVRKEIPDNYDGPDGQAKLALRRMEIIYRHASMNGDTDKANKMAFEIMQYSAGEAAKLGQQAVQAYKAGDVSRAIQLVADAHNQTPDGTHVAVDPSGKVATVTNVNSGKVVDRYPVTPEALFNAAMGYANRSGYWQVIAGRAVATNPAFQKDAAAGRRGELDAARIRLMNARIEKLKGGGGRAGAGAGPAPSGVAAALEAIESKRTPAAGGAGSNSSAPVPEGGGEGDEPTTATAQPDEATSDAMNGGEDVVEEGDSTTAGGPPRPAGAPPAPSGTTRPPPASVLRTKPGTAAQGTVRPGAPPAQQNAPAAREEPDPNIVPETIIGAQKAEPFNEPHPLAEWKGKNPYAAVLADPKLAGEFATKQGRAMKTGITAKRQELDREVRDWEKRKAATEKDAKASDKAAAKGSYGATYKGDQLETLTGNINTDIEARAKDTKVPSIYNDGSAKGTDLSDVATALVTSNRNLAPKRAVDLLSQLARSGDAEGEKNLRAFTPVGKDPLGNVVLQLKDDDTVKVHLPPDAYKKLNRIVESSWEKTVKGKKAAAGDSKKWSDVGDKVTGAAGDLSAKLANYVTSRHGFGGDSLAKDVGRGAVRAFTLPAHGARAALGAIDRYRKTADPDIKPTLEPGM